MFVITGATGNTGGVAAETLLQAGKKVRVVVRDAAKGEAWRKRGAEVAIADFADAPALTRAFQGAEGVYLMTPPLVHAADMNAERAPMIAVLVAASKAARVPHVVALSSIGAQHASGTGPIVGLHDLETRLKASGLTTTILRPGYFADNWGEMIPVAVAHGVLPAFIAPERRIPMVATPDIGRAAAAALLDPPAESRVWGLAGPVEASPTDVAAILARILGKPVQVAPVPYAAQKEALMQTGLPARTAENYAEMSVAIDEGRADYEGIEERRRGVEDLEQTLRRLAKAA